ncbi:tetratricopeptide repeat protein [Actinoplanes couchii]|uniref:Tetratricopeptide repeat protein n=1 Tax=Actinoplanes couchii TaxID=403638 RepID=A0ABQ3X012_9ACTN|nr:tetratricopeptide repeat protein [Actinoplanes couchii]MDR6316173.1 uncharacterized protein HemY [Actinoplanes couchii]GID51788.1 hypothetical protein Aco03nite_001920 [Actinoplanes couchii]
MDPDGPAAARILTYLGSVASDRADFGRARELLDRALARAGGRSRAYALSMLGRVHLRTGDPDAAACAI